MHSRLLLIAATLLYTSTSTAGDLGLPVPIPSEVTRTYFADTYDLFRCVASTSPELRSPAYGWTINYTDAEAFIDSPELEVRFQPVGPLQTEVRITAENAFALLYGRWLPSIEACALAPRHPDAAGPLPAPGVVGGDYRKLPVKARM